MSVVSEFDIVYLPPTTPSHIVCFYMFCLSLWCHCNRVSGFKPFTHSAFFLPLSLRFGVFYFPRQLNEGESSVFTTHTSCPKAPNQCNKPSHTLSLKTPGAFLYHEKHRTNTCTLSQSLIRKHIANILSFQSAHVCKLTFESQNVRSHPEPESIALKWHFLQSLILSCHKCWSYLVFKSEGSKVLCMCLT